MSDGKAPAEAAANPESLLRTSEFLADLADHCRAHDLTLGQVLARFDERSHAIVGVLFGAVFLFPVPIPGFSVILGSILVFVGLRMAEGKGPWLPKTWASRRMPGKLFTLTLDAAGKVARFFEPLTRPRLAVLHEAKSARRVNGTLIAVCGFLLALPLPPGTNWPPASAIILLCVGTMERDGLVVTLGYLASLINVIFFSALAAAGAAGLQALMTFLGVA